MSVGGFINKIGAGIKYAGLVGVTFATFTTAAYAWDLHFAIDKSQKHQFRRYQADKVACQIIDRTASPLPLNPAVDFNRLQTQNLDLTNSLEKRYLSMVQETTKSGSTFAVFAYKEDGKMVKRGNRFDLSDGKKYQLFEREGEMKMEHNQFGICPDGYDKRKLSKARPSRNEISGLRRDPLNNIISGYFFNRVVPSTKKEFVPDNNFSNKEMRVDSSVDIAYGKRDNGSAILGRVEKSLSELTDELYLHLKADRDVTIWTGDFGETIEIEKKTYKKKKLEKPCQVSVMAQIGNIAYNPLHLNIEEAKYLRDLLPSNVDMLIVDRSDNLENDLSGVTREKTDIAIISGKYWQNIGSYMPSAQRFKFTEVAEQIILEGSMITLPKGTEVVYKGSRIGIPVDKPDKMPVARFDNLRVSWISKDSDQLHELVSNNFVIPLNKKSISFKSYLDDIVINKVELKKEEGKPRPFIMLGPDESIVQVTFGVNWTNPWLEAMNKMERIGAYCMTYDSENKKFKFHFEGGIPPIQTLSVKRPIFKDIPKLVEK